ncbi:hypothetical protein YC2023_094694 [Brassica napus]
MTYSPRPRHSLWRDPDDGAVHEQWPSAPNHQNEQRRLSGRGVISITLVEKSALACSAPDKAGDFLAFDCCDGGPVASLARASFNLHPFLPGELNNIESPGYRP